jgi:hypothetical protein
MLEREFVQELQLRIDGSDDAASAMVTVTLADGRTYSATRDETDPAWFRAAVQLPEDVGDGEKVAFEIVSVARTDPLAPTRRRRGAIPITGRTWSVVGPEPRVADGCPRFPATPVVDETSFPAPPPGRPAAAAAGGPAAAAGRPVARRAPAAPAVPLAHAPGDPVARRGPPRGCVRGSCELSGVRCSGRRAAVVILSSGTSAPVAC